MAFNIPSQWGVGKATPSAAPKTWTRPSDWITITDVPNEVQFLVSDAAWLTYPLLTQFSRPGAENLYIDWGDGTIDTVTNTNTFTNHTYIAGTGTPCSRGYTTWKVRVYGDPGVIITDCRFSAAGTPPPIPYTVNVRNLASGLLEAYYGNGVQIFNFASYFTIPNVGITSNLLEYVKLPEDCSYNILSSFFDSTFYNQSLDNFNALAKIVMPITTGSTALDYQYTFSSLPQLLELTFPTTTKISTLVQTFGSCSSLQSVTFPTSSSTWDTTTSMGLLFSGCRLLTTVNNFPTNLPACTNFNQVFQACVSLNNVTVPSFGSGLTVSFTNTFQNSNQLRNVYWPSWNSGSKITATAMFSGCPNLLSITFPVNFDATSLASSFQNCVSLKSVVFQSACPSLTSLGNAFNGCSTLSQVTLPSSGSASVDGASVFASCASLESITIPPGLAFTSLASAFNSCSTLKTITIPNGITTITSLANTFTNCLALQTATLPSTLNSCLTAASVFSGCVSLQSVNFPTSLNVCTTMSQAFSGCRSLLGVTLPTSMPACTDFSQCFVNCNSISSITLPATVSSALTTYNNLANKCERLKTITLPTTQTASLVAGGITNLFPRCTSLQTVNNMDKIGNPATNGTILTGAGNISTGAFFGTYALTSISLSARLSVFYAGGFAGSPGEPSLLTSVRLTNTGSGQWTGSSPQVNVSYTGLSTAALVTLFNDLAAQGNVVSKTIDITNATGASGLTAADRLIVTSKGWTITG